MQSHPPPAWWRATAPIDLPAYGALQLQGQVDGPDLEAAPVDGHSGLRRLHLHRASLLGIAVPLDRMQLTVTWSEFDKCAFTQKSGRVLSEHGTAAQGSLGARPSMYRNCVFRGVRFKSLGGFSMGASRFENCTFIRCKFNGHSATEADLVNCRFVGKIDGCNWYSTAPGHKYQGGRLNEIVDNDFSRATLSDNIGWLGQFDIDAQTWPPGATPRPLDE